jgi:signal peptidase II
MEKRCTRKSHAVLYGIFLFLFLVMMDQCTKVWILGQESYQYLCNEGVAFGIMMPLSIFILVWICVMIFVLMLWRRNMQQDIYIHISFIAICAGAISNVIDRLWYGCVIDFIPFFQISSYNFADFLITCGAITLLWKSGERHE